MVAGRSCLCPAYRFFDGVSLTSKSAVGITIVHRQTEILFLLQSFDLLMTIFHFHTQALSIRRREKYITWTGDQFIPGIGPANQFFDITILTFIQRRITMGMVYTSQYRYSGPNRLDITIKGNPNHVLSPTWDLVKAYKNLVITNEQYTERYYTLLKKRMKTRLDEFMCIVNSPMTVLVCYCKSGDFCHRVLARNFLIHLGSKGGGEII